MISSSCASVVKHVQYLQMRCVVVPDLGTVVTHLFKKRILKLTANPVQHHMGLNS